MSWLLAALGFIALIVLHEFGHFIAAKAVGMRVEKFSLFFGPMFARFQRGETTYGIGPIPLGGYVKITGMNPAEEIPEEVAHRAYYRQPVWKRIVVISAGPAMNLLLAFLILWGLYAIQGQRDDRNPQQVRYVAAVEPGSPADGTLKADDKILSIDGKANPNDFRTAIASHTCAGTPKQNCKATTPATVVVMRDGKQVTLKVTPVYDATPKIERTRLGFSYAGPWEPQPLGTAAKTSVDAMWFVTHTTVSKIGQIFYSSEARKQVSGVVGSYEATRQSFNFDVPQAIFVLALISLSLAVVNLFPFLPLDGGHIFWAVAEKIRGRPIPFAVMERAGFVGFALIAMLFVLGLSNDIGNITSDGLSK